MLKKLIDGIMAGIMISIGGCVFLALRNVNNVAGAILFSVALLCICYKGYSLFTGKVGYLVTAHGKEEWSVLLLGLLGNLISTVSLGFATSYAIPANKEVAAVICEAKLDQPLLAALIRAILCGVLMYLAVNIYKENKSIAGIFFCVPVFILSGFEHSIANMFYFAASGIVSFKAFLYLWVIILGNSIGGMLMPFLSMLGKEKKNA